MVVGGRGGWGVGWWVGVGWDGCGGEGGGELASRRQRQMCMRDRRKSLLRHLPTCQRDAQRDRVPEVLTPLLRYMTSVMGVSILSLDTLRELLHPHASLWRILSWVVARP